MHVEASGRPDVLADALRGLDEVSNVTVTDTGVDLLVRDARRMLPRIVERAESGGVSLQSVDVSEPDLEAVFLHLTGKALRD